MLGSHDRGLLNCVCFKLSAEARNLRSDLLTVPMRVIRPPNFLSHSQGLGTSPIFCSSQKVNIPGLPDDSRCTPLPTLDQDPLPQQLNNVLRLKRYSSTYYLGFLFRHS